MDRDRPSLRDRTFVRRSAIWFAMAAALFLAWRLVDVIVLAFGGVVIAVLLRSLSEPIRDHGPLGDSLSVVMAILVIAAIAGGAGWLFGHTLSSQISGLSDILPHSLSALRAQVAGWPLGDLIDRYLLSGSLPTNALVGRIGGYAMNAATAAVDVIAALFVGVFLAMEPHRSRDGVLMLFPRRIRPALAEASNVSGRALRLWLGGILVEMATIGVMTGLGAWLVGLPTPLALGVIGGLAEIVPYVGPVVSAVPGLLLAASIGWTTVFWTLVMYLLIHQIEGNLVYPFIQRRAAHLPPTLTLLSVLVATVLLGPIGVVLASPLLVVGLTFLKLLYVRRTLGEEVTVAGEPPRDAPP